MESNNKQTMLCLH